MPVATVFSKYCPLLLESDVLSLSPEFALRQDFLHDTTLGISHGLVQPGEKLILLLQDGMRLQLLRKEAAVLGVTNWQLTELLGFLNLTGALQMHRRIGGRLHAAIIKARDACLNIYYTPLAWRRPASFLTLASGIGRATLPVSFASMVVSSLFIYAGQPLTVHGIALFGLLLFLASLYCHEYMHMAVIGSYRKRTALLQRGMRLGVIHAQLPRRGEVATALAGPMAGALCCLAASLVLFFAQAKLLALLGLTTALFHLFSLMPFYGDGASLQTALSGKRSS